MTSYREGLLHLTKVADSFGQAASHYGFHITPLSFFLENSSIYFDILSDAIANL